MAKKIKFALKLNDVDVRTLESLQENFEFEKVVAYFLDGKLLTQLTLTSNFATLSVWSIQAMKKLI